jgi:uncharacterized damage-inducible protein DinB
MDAHIGLLAEFDHEMAVTRRMLDRVPDEAFSWKPHEKSFSLGGLATHLAELTRWGNHILEHDSYDIATSGRRTNQMATRGDVLETFDRHVADVRRNLTSTASAALGATWSLKRGAETMMAMPRLTAFKRFVISHAIHHRGQLSVYLRIQNVPVPGSYGPSADEVM